MDFHVIRNRKDVSGQIVGQNFPGFAQCVDVGCRAVTGLGNLLHHCIIVVAAPETEHRQVDARLALAGDEIFQLFRVGNADIEIAIGQQHHPVDRIFLQALFGEGISKAQPFAASS